MDITLKDLGLSGQPSEGVYRNVAKFSSFLLNTALADSFEMSGEENLNKEALQMFLSNHLYYTDPVLAQTAIICASKNDTPIPAPAYKSYVKHRVLGPIMVSLFSFPIYGKEDGYGQREKALQYCFQCFLRQERILLFPGGQIDHNGIPSAGRFGSAEIAWRAYHAVNDFKKGKNNEKIEMVPMNISYYPTAGLPLSEMGKISVRFGRPIDIKAELLDKFHSPLYMFHNDMRLKKQLQKRLMEKITQEISLLTTININQIISWMIYYLASEKKRFMLDRCVFDNLLFDIIDNLKEKEGLYLINHLKDCDLTLRAYDLFMNYLFRKNVIVQHVSRRREEIIGFNLDYVLKKHKYKAVRDDNTIFYNYNLINHLDSFKNIAKVVINNEL